MFRPACHNRLIRGDGLGSLILAGALAPPRASAGRQDRSTSSRASAYPCNLPHPTYYSGSLVATQICRTAMARDLEADMETLRTVLNLAQNRDFERAGALAEQTLASGFEHPLLLNVACHAAGADRGNSRSRCGCSNVRFRSRPEMSARAMPWRLCLQRLDRPAEALDHMDELLKKQPDLSFAHANKGNALIALGFPAARSRATCGRWSWNPAISPVGRAGLDRHAPRRTRRGTALGRTGAQFRSRFSRCHLEPCRRRFGERRTGLG